MLDPINVLTGLIFLIGLTIMDVFGVSKEMLLISLVAICFNLLGLIWLFEMFDTAWYIPAFFTIINVVIFYIGVSRGRG